MSRDEEFSSFGRIQREFRRHRSTTCRSFWDEVHFLSFLAVNGESLGLFKMKGFKFQMPES